MKRLVYSLVTILVFIGILLLYISHAYAAGTTVVFTSNGTFTAPAGVFNVQVQGWAGGGGGGTGITNSSGGGGGAYSGLVSFPVIPGNTYTVIVGQGGAVGVSGGDTMFNSSTTLLAKGGVAANGRTLGTGGVAASGAGDITRSGGNGGNGFGAGTSGAGGGGGGTLRNGTNGAASTNIGIGGIVGGGNGGSFGGNGVSLGGGGGGTLTTPGTGAGASGEVDITYGKSSVVVIGNSRVTVMKGTVLIR